MTGHCLVDYDNLEHRDRELGLAVLARRIAAAVSADKPGLKALSLRLYGRNEAHASFRQYLPVSCENRRRLAQHPM